MQEINISQLDRSKIKFLLFDLDGTLIHMNRSVPYYILAAHVWRFKKIFPPAKSLQVLKQAINKVKNNQTTRNNYEIIISHYQSQCALSRNELLEIFSKLLFVDFKRTRHFFSPVKYGVEILEAAKKKQIKLVLATNPLFELNAVKMRMAWGQIDPDLFIHITHNQNSLRCKPHCEYYQFMLNELNILPEQALLIGNDFRKDYPATEVGLNVFMLKNSCHRKALKTRPFYQGTMLDLLKWLS